MTKTVEFCFDIVSPAAFLAWHVLPRVAEKAGAEIKYTPMFLGGLMEAAGNRPPMTCPNKGKWMNSDLQRWAALWGLEFSRPSAAARFVAQARQRGVLLLAGGADVGPAGSYGGLTVLSKAVLMFEMVLGRLEILAPIVLFLPGLWRR